MSVLRGGGMRAKDVRQIAHWSWGMIWNRPLVWENADGTFSHTEKVRRFKGPFSRWTIRPMIFHTAFTTRPDCGCRKRFGLWRTIWCSKCSKIELGL